MAYQDRFYTTGAVTVQNGSAVVTGEGTGWETALIDGGVIFVGGGSYPILSVESETSLTLAMPYAGDDGSAQLYAIDRQRAVATSNIQMNDRLAQIIREISIGNIESLNAIDFTGREILQTDATGLLIAIKLAANKFLRTDANGDLALSDLGTAAIALLNLAGTAAADRVPYLTSANAAGLAALTAYARTALAATNEAAARTIMGANRPMFSAVASSDVSISNGSYTGVPLNNVTVNVGNSWNGTRFLCPEAGNYFFSFSAQWNGGNSNTGFGTARIKKNGVAVANFGASKTLWFMPITVQAILPLAVGDTVIFEFVLNDAAGSGITLQVNNTSGTGFLIR